MNNYTMDNTQDFTQEELDKMNNIYETWVTHDMDEDQKQAISEKIINDF